MSTRLCVLGALRGGRVQAAGLLEEVGHDPAVSGGPTVAQIAPRPALSRTGLS